MQLSIEEIEQHTDESNGYCRKCDDVTQLGLVEPDARKRKCPSCEQFTLYGVEWAAIAGWVVVTE